MGEEEGEVVIRSSGSIMSCSMRAPYWSADEDAIVVAVLVEMDGLLSREVEADVALRSSQPWLSSTISPAVKPQPCSSVRNDRHNFLLSLPR